MGALAVRQQQLQQELTRLGPSNPETARVERDLRSLQASVQTQQTRVSDAERENDTAQSEVAAARAAPPAPTTTPAPAAARPAAARNTPAPETAP